VPRVYYPGSTPRFLLTTLVIDFVLMFLLNGLLNEVLELGVPSWLIGVPPTVVLLVLLPRWEWFRQRMQGRAESK
jgi:chromate transport protein ChrA